MSEHPPGPPPAPAPDPKDAPPAAPGSGGADAGALWDRIVRAIERPVEHAVLEYRLSLVVLFLLAAGTLWLSQRMVDRDFIQIGRMADAKVAQLASQVGQGLDQRARAIGDLAERWSGLPEDDAAWSRDAALVIQRDIQFRAIAWYDPALRVKRMRPTTADIPLAALDRQDEAARQHVMTTMSSTEPAFSPSYLVGDSKRQVMVRALVPHPNAAPDFMIGVARPGDLCDALVGQEIKNGWSIAIYEGPYQIFGPVWADAGPEIRWTREAQVRAGGWALSVRIWPSEELARTMRGPEAMTVFVAGMVLALLIAVLVRRIQVLSRRAAAA